MSSPRLPDIFSSATQLLGLAEAPARISQRPSLSTLLCSRLAASSLSPPLTTSPEPSERALKPLTAVSALHHLLLLAHHADNFSEPDAQPSPSTSKARVPEAPPAPLWGVKDLKVIGMLGGVVGRWGVGEALKDGVIPAQLREKRGKVVELVEEDERAGEGLEETLRGVVEVVRGGEDKQGRRTLGKTVLGQLVLPLMGGLVQFGWDDSEGRDVQSASATWAQTQLRWICSSNPPTVTIANLLALLSSSSASAASQNPWLRPALSSLLSSQLVRPGGVRSLLLVVVGFASDASATGEEEIGVKKLDMLTRLLGAKSDTIDDETYYPLILRQLHQILYTASLSSLSPTPLPSTAPIPILRATSFILSHLFLSPSSPPIVHSTLSTLLHSPFLTPSPTSTPLLPHLTLLSLLALYAPPLPSFLSALIIPVLPHLLSLSAFLNKKATIVIPDERYANECSAVLEVWGKSVSPVEEGVREVGRAIERWEKEEEEDGAGEWKWDDEGGVLLVEREEKEEKGVEVKVEAELVVTWLKEVGRKELSAGCFLRWLDEIAVLRGVEGIEGAKKSVVRLQLVLKMVEEFGSEMLEQPEQILNFVAHALEADKATQQDEEDADEVILEKSSKEKGKEREMRSGGIGLADLRIVDEDELEAREREEVRQREEMEDENDEDREIPGLGKDEMAMTALTLLLAVLEANEHLTMESTPLLSLINTHLTALLASPSPLIPPLAREARAVLSLRRLSSLAPAPPSTSSSIPDPHAASRATYQSSLKLLQDPLLPLRAQGLAQLRSLINTRDALLSTDPALLPALVDIFVQSLEEEDSFLYLNAIQGLSALADGYGKEVVRRLVKVYLGGKAGSGEMKEVGSGEKGRRELDKRLRMGEALVQVVQRAGEALAVFVDDLLPSLLLILRTQTLPTPLRSSALTILATTIETSALPLLPYIDDLAQTCLTLLSVESRPMQPRRREPEPTPKSGNDGSDDEEAAEEAPRLGKNGKPVRPEETPDPVDQIDRHHPSLRRAAILFLGLLFRMSAHLAEEQMEQTQRGYDSVQPLGTFRLGGGGEGRMAQTSIVSAEVRERTKIVLRYLGDTDEDSLVRHQAREVLEEMGVAL